MWQNFINELLTSTLSLLYKETKVFSTNNKDDDGDGDDDDDGALNLMY